VNTIRSFLREEVGFLLSTETVLLGTILVIGMIVGLAEVRNAVTEELGDFSQAIAWLSQDRTKQHSFCRKQKPNLFT